MRNGYLDAVRVIGIVAVVLGHVEALGPVRELVYPWHVPLFFVLSGWFWSRGRSLRTEVVNRWRTLALPYLAWFVVVTTGYLIGVVAGGGDPLHAMIGPLAGGAHAVQPYSAFWFISALAVAAVATRVIEVVGWPVAAQVAVGAALCIAVQVAQGPAAESPWAIAQGLACVVYVQIGMLLRRARRLVRYAPVLVVGGAVLAALPGVEPLDIKVADFGTPVISFVASVLICAGLVVAPIHLGGRASRAASTLAGAGLAVILGHALILWFFIGDLPPAVLAIAAVVVPWVIGLAIARTRWGRFFGCTAPRPVSERPATG